MINRGSGPFITAVRPGGAHRTNHTLTGVENIYMFTCTHISFGFVWLLCTPDLLLVVIGARARALARTAKFINSTIVND